MLLSFLLWASQVCGLLCQGDLAGRQCRSPSLLVSPEQPPSIYLFNSLRGVGSTEYGKATACKSGRHLLQVGVRGASTENQDAGEDLYSASFSLENTVYKEM